MSQFLDSDNFGLKLYNTLPPLYRNVDADVNFALKKYLESLADGGFKYVIEEINGLTTLVDAESVASEYLPIIFKHFGFEVFHGIPELYLRKMLHILPELYSRKGTVVVIEYLTSIVSGAEANVEIISNGEEYKGEETVDNSLLNHSNYILSNNFFLNGYYSPYGYKETGKYRINLVVTLDDESKDAPKIEHLKRIIKEFVPFFFETTIVFVYSYQENIEIKVDCSDTSVVGDNKVVEIDNGISVVDEEIMESTDSDEESSGMKNLMLDTFLNNSTNLLSNSFCLNGIYNYDEVTHTDGTIERLVRLEDGNTLIL